MKKNIKFYNGLSLIEIVIVMGLFAILGVLATRAVFLSLSGGKKGDSLVKVRDNVDYAMGIIERQLRGSEGINPCLSGQTQISYLDAIGNQTSFSCQDIGIGGYIASGSASTRLTTSDVAITACSFSCTQGTASNPSQVQIDFTAQDVNAPSGVSGSTITLSTKIDLRTY